MQRAPTGSSNTHNSSCSHFLKSSTTRALARGRVANRAGGSASVYRERGKSRLLALAGCLLSLLLGNAALAQDVLPGYDLFETEPGATYMDFSSMPLPADFFGPGSDPFDGIIYFRGDPQPSGLCPNDDLSRVDTIVERIGVSSHPPEVGLIDIQIVELHLVSVEPIVVTYMGGQNPELWDVVVGLSDLPQVLGVMEIVQFDPTGGIFNSILPVLPKFTFIQHVENLQEKVS